ncbi:MAG: hypothetical protein AB1630_04960 [bacterium]
MKKLLALVVFGLSFLTQEARAADWYVPSQYGTIAAAISAATSGDAIYYVAPGNYNEAVYRNHKINGGKIR